MTFILAARTALLSGSALILCACTETTPPDDAQPMPGEMPVGDTLADEPKVSWQAPDSCPPWASDDRPEGSNCHGILPETCGADRAAAFVGRVGTPDVRAEMEDIAVRELRWLPPQTGYTEDLSNGRLNIILDENNVITKVDCY